MKRIAFTVGVVGAMAAIASGALASGTTTISQSAVAGARLGQTASAYKTQFGAFSTGMLKGPDYPTLIFASKQVSVYFHSPRGRAIIITTWNRHFRTSKGIGPCSTLAAMKKAYGTAVKPAWAGTDPNDTSVHHSYVVGDNLVFATQDMRTVATVALYRGTPGHTKGGSPQAYANYAAANEPGC